MVERNAGDDPHLFAAGVGVFGDTDQYFSVRGHPDHAVIGLFSAGDGGCRRCAVGDQGIG